MATALQHISLVLILKGFFLLALSLTSGSASATDAVLLQAPGMLLVCTLPPRVGRTRRSLTQSRHTTRRSMAKRATCATKTVQQFSGYSTASLC
jgi:hypothetical protein